MCDRMDIDVWEVIDAAKTKPFGFMPFYPGPGLGGHCIPIDPVLSVLEGEADGFECRFIELAGHVNGSMPDYVVERIGDALNTKRKAINGLAIHLFGIAYKKDVGEGRGRRPPRCPRCRRRGGGGGVSYAAPGAPGGRAPCACSRLPKTPWTGLTAR